MQMYIKGRPFAALPSSRILIFHSFEYPNILFGIGVGDEAVFWVCGVGEILIQYRARAVRDSESGRAQGFHRFKIKTALEPSYQKNKFIRYIHV